MKVHHYSHNGRFNFMRTDEQQTQVCLFTSLGNVSCMWPLDESPYEEEMRPSDVSQILRKRINSYLFMSDRATKLATLDAIDAKANELDRAWMLERAKQLQARAASAYAQALALRNEADELEETA